MAAIPANICEPMTAKTPLPGSPIQPEQGGLLLLEHLLPFLQGANPELGESRSCWKSWAGWEGAQRAGAALSAWCYSRCYPSHVPVIPWQDPQHQPVLSNQQCSEPSLTGLSSPAGWAGSQCTAQSTHEPLVLSPGIPEPWRPHLPQELLAQVAGCHAGQVLPAANLTPDVSIEVGSLQHHPHHHHCL